MGERVVGMVSPNTCISTEIGEVLTSYTCDEHGWTTRRSIVTGVKDGWLTTVPDPDVPQGAPQWR